MERYELIEGTSSKFWEIARTDTGFATRFGRIGTAGQESEKAFDEPAKAKREYEKIVAEKVKKGYALVGGLPASAAKPVAAAVGAAKVEAKVDVPVVAETAAAPPSTITTR